MALTCSPGKPITSHFAPKRLSLLIFKRHRPTGVECLGTSAGRVCTNFLSNADRRLFLFPFFPRAFTRENDTLISVRRGCSGLRPSSKHHVPPRYSSSASWQTAASRECVCTFESRVFLRVFSWGNRWFLNSQVIRIFIPFMTPFFRVTSSLLKTGSTLTCSMIILRFCYIQLACSSYSITVPIRVFFAVYFGAFRAFAYFSVGTNVNSFAPFSAPSSAPPRRSHPSARSGPHRNRHQRARDRQLQGPLPRVSGRWTNLRQPARPASSR